MTTQQTSEGFRGSLDLLVLKALSLGSVHGWGIGQRIQELSHGAMEVNQGSLYPALQRMEQRGLIRSSWQQTENNRRARYYELTPSGRRALGVELESWKKFAAAIELVLSAT